jgi:integrase
MAGRYSLRERNGKVQARWYTDDGRRHSRMFPTRTEAKRYLDRVSADRQRGDYIAPEDAARLFRDVAADWLAAKVKRPKTLAGYESLLRNHLLPFFGTLPVGAIRTSHVRRWLAEMQRAGKAPGTVRNAYRVLTPILNRAVEDGCIRANPCGPIRLIDDLPRSRPRRMLFLNAEEVTQLADACPEPWGTLVQFAPQTGMRAGEIAALRMQHVNLLRREVEVVESISEVKGQLHFVPPKTGEERKVVLSESLTKVLRDYIVRCPAKGPRDFLFSSPEDPATPIRHNAWFYLKVFKPAVHRARLNPALRFHDLRHTAASLLIAANVPPKVIQEHLGHASFAITMDRYGHLYPDTADAVREAMESAFTPRTATGG